MISTDGEYKRLDKNNLSSDEVSLIFIRDFNNTGIICNGKNAGMQVDFANIK